MDIEQDLPHTVIDDNNPGEMKNFSQDTLVAAWNAGIEDPHQAPTHPQAMIIEDEYSIDEHDSDIGANDMNDGNDEDDVSIPQQVQEEEDVVDHVPEQHQEERRTSTE